MKIVSFVQLSHTMYIRHFFRLTVTAVLFMGIAAACKDKDPKPSTSGPCDVCQTAMSAKKYFNFKVGSWWVYEEENSHERDSMYVADSYDDTNSFAFLTTIKSTRTDYEYRYWPVYYSGGGNGQCSMTGLLHQKCVYVTFSKGKFQDLLGESKVLFFRYNVGDYIYTGDVMSCPNNKLTIAAESDSFMLPNETVGKTICTTEDCSVQEGRQPLKVYYTENVGIIRRELLDSNQVWNLVNYHIEP